MFPVSAYLGQVEGMQLNICMTNRPTVHEEVAMIYLRPVRVTRLAGRAPRQRSLSASR